MAETLKIKGIPLPHRLILAPMCGITVKPFREICKEWGAGLVYNQMVSANALTLGDKKSLSLLAFSESERPIGMQIFGNEASTLVMAAHMIQDTGVDIIDLNLGCPAKKIVNGGGGAALLTDLKKLAIILRRLRAAITIAFTIKIRAGWDDASKNALAIAKIAEGEGVDAMALHARTRAQGYSGKSDWHLIKHVKENAAIPIIGNGDILNAADARRMLEETGCDAVMTGRGAFATPWIFKNFIDKKEETPPQEEVKKLITHQYDRFIAHYGPDTGITLMRKFVCALSKGMPHGAKLRSDIMSLSSWFAIKEILDAFYQ